MSKTRMVVFRGYSCHEMQKAERRMLSGNSSEKEFITGRLWLKNRNTEYEIVGYLPVWKIRWFMAPWKKGMLLALKIAGGMFAGAVVVCVAAEWYIYSVSEGRIVEHSRDVPVRAPVLVLGCSPTFMGSPNGYFHNRMDTASELWKDGKATVFIVSGDNSSHAYNEPEWMKQALVERGVPEERIVCDFAGLRTLDSVVRMKEIFGVSTMIVVSQEFHNERALAIAAHEGMAAWAVSAPDVPNRRSRIKSWFRERAARVWMMLDLWVWSREPRFWENLWFCRK